MMDLQDFVWFQAYRRQQLKAALEKLEGDIAGRSTSTEREVMATYFTAEIGAIDQFFARLKMKYPGMDIKAPKIISK